MYRITDADTQQSAQPLALASWHNVPNTLPSKHISSSSTTTTALCSRHEYRQFGLRRQFPYHYDYFLTPPSYPGELYLLAPLDLPLPGSCPHPTLKHAAQLCRHASLPCEISHQVKSISISSPSHVKSISKPWSSLITQRSGRSTRASCGCISALDRCGACICCTGA